MDNILHGKMIFDINKQFYTIDTTQELVPATLTFDDIIFVAQKWNYLSNPDCNTIYYVLLAGHTYYFFKYYNNMYEGYPIDNNKMDIASYLFEYKILNDAVFENNSYEFSLLNGTREFPKEESIFGKYSKTISMEMKRKLNEDFNYFKNNFRVI